MTPTSANATLPFQNKSAAPRTQITSSYLLWRADPFANSLHFKEVNKKEAVWSVRAGIGYRALGTRDGNTMFWTWIGSHAAYDRLVKNLG